MKELKDTFEIWEGTTLYQIEEPTIAQAEQEGYERGKLSEIENSAVGDIKIVSDKVEQIKAQAIAEERARVVGEIEKRRKEVYHFPSSYPETLEYKEDVGYNQALDDLLSALDKEINKNK